MAFRNHENNNSKMVVLSILDNARNMIVKYAFALSFLS
jgi:hypothetical protein